MSAMYFFLLIPPFVISIGLLWLMLRAHRRYELCKKTLVDGMGVLDEDTLSVLGWKSRRFVSGWETLAVWMPGWQSVGLDYQLQQQDLQRVAIQGLPKAIAHIPTVELSARMYRLVFWCFVAPGTFIVLTFGSVHIAQWLDASLSISPRVSYLVLLVVFLVSVLLPMTKLKRWPDIEDQS